MTIQEAIDRARDYGRISLFRATVGWLRQYVIEADNYVYAKVLEANPSLMIRQKAITFPAATVTMQAAQVTQDPIAKVVMVAGKIGNSLWTRFSTAVAQEMSGDGVPVDLGVDTATPNRWLFNGDGLSFYPTFAKDTDIVVFYQFGLKNTNVRSDVLEGMPPQVQAWAHVVPLVAARNMHVGLGVAWPALEKLMGEQMEAMLSYIGTLQAQESATIGNVRWRL